MKIIVVTLTPLADTGLAGSVEAEAEDNASDDGCSVGETEYSPAGASETSAERAYVLILFSFISCAKPSCACDTSGELMIVPVRLRTGTKDAPSPSKHF